VSKNIKEEIEKLILTFKQLPYLFVGTGLSMRYSNAPSWNDLLKNIWLIMNNNNENGYKKFVQKVTYELNITSKVSDDEQKKYYLNPQLATRIQEQFNNKFYNDDSFEKIIFTEEEVSEILDNNYDPFKFYVAKQTKDLRVISDKEEYKEIAYIKKNNSKIAGVITTNYDYILEELFEDFDVVVGQDNILVSNTNNIFEIFKIHGSANQPNSIVITQDDYDYFETKLKYLSAKLLTLFVEHPIIFIGYSIGDLNIRFILEEIANCLNKEQLQKIKNNFIFINPASGGEEKISDKEIEFGEKRIIMNEITLNDFSVLFESLSNIKSSMPIKLIRKMQDMICNFIATTDANNNIMVGSIDNADIGDKDLGVYFGKLDVVSDMGFDYYGIMDIIEDILFDNKPNLINDKLINKTFKNIRSCAGQTYLPVYKYIKKLNVNVEDLSNDWKIIKSIDDIKLTSTEVSYTREGKEYNCINDIEIDYKEHIPKQLAYIIYSITKEKLEKDDLKEYLKIKIRDAEFMNKYSSQIKKLSAIYDYIENSK